MGTGGKLILAGVAGYFVWKWWLEPQMAATAATAAAAPAPAAAAAAAVGAPAAPAPAAPTTGGPQPGPTPGVTPAAVQTVTPAVSADMLLAAAQAAGSGPSTVTSKDPQSGGVPLGGGIYAVTGFFLTADQWNWFYGKVSGVPQTADLFTPGNRGELIDAPTYMNRRSAAGLSGLGIVGPYMVMPPFPNRSKMDTYWPWTNDPRSVLRFQDSFAGIGQVRRRYFSDARSGLSSACDPKAVVAAMGSN